MGKECLKLFRVIIPVSAAFFLFCACGKMEEPDTVNVDTQSDSGTQAEKDAASGNEAANLIDPSGNALETRIRTPEGYTRTEEAEGSLGQFLRNYELKPDGSPVLLYDGRKKTKQKDHAAIFALPIENEDLQQCADTVMRVFGEYYYSRGEYGKIVFTLGGNFQADFSKWAQGRGIQLQGNDLIWTSAPENDFSYESFKRFMRIVFAYSGTLNMEADSAPIEEDDIQIGDIFIRGGSPGHVVMVVDLCQDAAGRKAFLLAQGYMPAQEFHVLKNPAHDDDPWYYVDEISYPFHTPEYTFEEGSLKRYKT